MPLTLQYCSDLHFEFDLNRKWIHKYPLAVEGDVLLLAGDVVPFWQLAQHRGFFDFVARNYQATYWIPGNHEYYGGDIAQRSGAFLEKIRDNVFLLNNTTVELGDVALICATLWSYIDPVYEWEIRRAMSDFHVIKNGSYRLDVDTYNRLHKESMEYLRQALADNTEKRKVIMTHHVPTFMNYPKQFKGSILNRAFATELHDFIEGSGAECWIYGHTHSNTPDFMIGKTHLLTNQLGYVQQGEHTSFNKSKVFVLQ